MCSAPLDRSSPISAKSKGQVCAHTWRLGCEAECYEQMKRNNSFNKKGKDNVDVIGQITKTRLVKGKVWQVRRVTGINSSMNGKPIVSLLESTRCF